MIVKDTEKRKSQLKRSNRCPSKEHQSEGETDQSEGENPYSGPFPEEFAAVGEVQSSTRCQQDESGRRWIQKQQL